MYSEKVFAVIVIAFIMVVALTILTINENDMYSMGYEWVPTVQGHWEKKNAEVPK